jgi:hypothetical protein
MVLPALAGASRCGDRLFRRRSRCSLQSACPGDESRHDISLRCRLCPLRPGAFSPVLLYVSIGGDRRRFSPIPPPLDCDPGALRFLGASPRGTKKPTLVYRESRFLLVLDEPEGVPGGFELFPPCEVGGCQWWKYRACSCCPGPECP